MLLGPPPLPRKCIHNSMENLHADAKVLSIEGTKRIPFLEIRVSLMLLWQSSLILMTARLLSLVERSMSISGDFTTQD